MPPSVNEYLFPVMGKKAIGKNGREYYKGRLVKSQVHRDYLERAHLWRLHNRPAVWRIQAVLKDLRKRVEADGGVFSLKVEGFFAFEYSRVNTKKGQSEKLDTDNRIKPLMDALSEVLEIDDKYFYYEGGEKVTTQVKDLECVIIKITPWRPRTLEDVKNQMHREVISQQNNPKT